MKLSDKYVVGNDIYVILERVECRKRVYNVSKRVIASVGRKYVTAGRDRFIVLHENDIFLTNSCSLYSYPKLAFPTEKEALEYIEAQDVIDDIHDEIDYIRHRFNTGQITIDALRKVSDLIK